MTCNALGAGQLRPRRCRGDTDTLLAARASATAKFRGGQVFAEYLGNLVHLKTGTVIADTDTDQVRVLDRAGADFFYLDGDFGKNPLFLARIERVIDGLFESGQNRFGGR